MLLTITTTHRPATDLGYLLHKHPDRVQTFGVPFGEAHVFYPEATDERCTAALLMAVDPVGLVRRGGGRGSFALAEYVNDRPYVASSFLSVAMNAVFKTAMAGTCKERPELAAVAASARGLDARRPRPRWRAARAAALRAARLRGRTRRRCRSMQPRPNGATAATSTCVSAPTSGSRTLLNHLYVLLPVLDDDKHYWVDEAEIEKLMRRGEGWLAAHPERDLIVRRYLKRAGAGCSIRRLRSSTRPPRRRWTPRSRSARTSSRSASRLRDQRLGTVQAVLKASGARRVLDLGCGAGALLERLLRDGYDEIIGVDVSARALEAAHRELKLDRLHDAQRQRIKLLQSPLTYRDKRLTGLRRRRAGRGDRAPRSAAAGGARAERVRRRRGLRPVVVTTPNAEYNVRWETLPAGEFRHPDHRFEWTRARVRGWADGVAARHGYAVRFLPVGPEDPEVGPPTQMAVFER